MTRRQIMATVAAGAAGLAAALALTLAPTANAYAPDQLPSLGYSVSVLSLGDNCHSWSATGYGAHADLGSDCEPGFQAALDAFVTATCPCAQPPTTATTEAATAPVTTTETTATATTSTSPGAPEPPAQDATAPVTAPAATTTDYQAQIADLQAQIAALKARVDKLEAAADAEWASYHDALVAGVDPIIASMIARQTGYDLIHGTGPFAP